MALVYGYVDWTMRPEEVSGYIVKAGDRCSFGFCERLDARTVRVWHLVPEGDVNIGPLKTLQE